MTHTPSPTVKEDREAAADLFAGTPWSRDQFLSGKRDHQSKVQAFAAHRELGERRAEAAVVGQAAQIAALTERVHEHHRTLCFLGKWIERGLFDPAISSPEALGMMAHYPGMPWNSERWDVDHKPYAAEYYARFPRTALKGSDQ